MQRVINLRLFGLGLAALLTIGATFSVTATFSASEPGSGLEPVGGAAELVSLLQGQEHIVWTALTGSVTSYTVVGWPVSDGDVELGGAMVMERPADGSTGVIDFGERPMTLSFELNG